MPVHGQVRSGQYFITTELLTVDTADCIINVLTTQLVTVESGLCIIVS